MKSFKIKNSFHKKSFRDRNGAEGGGNRRKLLLPLIIIAATLITICVAVFALERQRSLKGIRDDSFESTADDVYEDSMVTFSDTVYRIRDRYDTFLFMGTDYSGDEENEKEYVGSLTDFLMLMVINHTEDTYAFLPIDRNTVTDVQLMEPDGNVQGKVPEQICTAHWYGGNKEMSCENTVTAVSDYLGGLSIDAYYAISMSEIPRINHAIGGVEVTLEDDFTKEDPAMKKGETLLLSDSQAAIYLRGRMSMKNDTNKNRMKRQKTYLSAALDKCKSEIRENPNFFEETSEEFEDAATSTITPRQMSRAANAFAEYEDLGTFEIKGETKLGTILGDGEEHEEFYPDEDSVLEIMQELYHLEKTDIKPETTDQPAEAATGSESD